MGVVMGFAYIFAGCDQVIGMGENNQLIADWISKYLVKSKLIDTINMSDNLQSSDGSSRLSTESWRYIESVLNEDALIAMACKALGIEASSASGGIIYKVFPKH